MWSLLGNCHGKQLSELHAHLERACQTSEKNAKPIIRPVGQTVFRIARLILILRIRINILIWIYFVKFGKLTMISIHFVKFSIFTLISIQFVKFRIFSLISIHFEKFRIFTLISIRFINSGINTSILIHITRKLEILRGLILWLLYSNFGYNSLKPHNIGMNNAL